MRTIMDLPDEDVSLLDSFCEKERISRAEGMRRALKLYLEKFKVDIDYTNAFGLWKERAQDGLEYERVLRAEWE